MSAIERFYYINTESKVIRHYPEKQKAEPQGFEYSGMSQMPIKSAASFYARGQTGYTIVDSESLVDIPSSAPVKGEEE